MRLKEKEKQFVLYVCYSLHFFFQHISLHYTTQLHGHKQGYAAIQQQK